MDLDLDKTIIMYRPIMPNVERAWIRDQIDAYVNARVSVVSDLVLAYADSVNAHATDLARRQKKGLLDCIEEAILHVENVYAGYGLSAGQTESFVYPSLLVLFTNYAYQRWFLERYHRKVRGGLSDVMDDFIDHTIDLETFLAFTDICPRSHSSSHS